MHWRIALLVLWNDPVVVTDDHKTFDQGIWFISRLVFIVSVLFVLNALGRACRHYHGRHPDCGLPRAFWLFITLAVAVSVVTGGLQLEHKLLKHEVRIGNINLTTARQNSPTPYGDLNAVEAEHRTEIGKRVSRHMQFLHRAEAKIWNLTYAAKRNYANEHSPENRHRTKTVRRAKDVVRREMGRLPYFEPKDWPLRHGTWRDVDVLLDTPGRFFWSFQWIAGFVAWVLYIAVESELHRLSEEEALSLVCLGVCGSMAASQCLFFALISIMPAKRTGTTGVARIWVSLPYTLATLAVAHFLLLLFERGWWWLELQEELKREDIQTGFAMLKALLCICLFGNIIMSRYLPWLKEQVPIRRAKQRLTFEWYVIALAGCATSVYTSISTWSHSELDEKLPFYLSAPAYPWSQGRNPMDHHRNSLFLMSGVFGDHPLINAIAFDVLFSAIALACWSAVERLDARDMARCALFPWRDLVTERIKLMRYHDLPDAVSNGGLRGGATRSGKTYLPREGGATRSGKSYVVQGEPSESSSEEESASPPVKQRPQRKMAGRPRSKEPVAPTSQTRGRSGRGASSRAACAQPTLAEQFERRRSRSASARLPVSGTCSATETARRGGGARKIVSPAPSHHNSRAASGAWRRSQIREENLLSSDLPDGRVRRVLPARTAFEDLAGQAEQAGLTLALFAVGGLGMASAAVFGAEGLEV